MKNWQIYLVGAIIIVAGIGIMLWAKSNTSRTTTDLYSSNSAANETNANSNTNQTNTEPMTETTGKKYVTMTIKNFGDVKIEMYEQDAPKTVANFVGLAEKGFYNGLTFHRIIPGFVVQGGDPTGTGSGGESIYGGEFADELNPDAPSFKTGYVKGVVAMANRGPNTNTSQFFFCLTDLNQSLGKLYTIFGKVVEGQDVVDKVAAKGSASGQPSEKIVIEKAVVSDK